MMTDMRQAPRQHLADRKILEMSVVSFKRMDRNDLVAKMIDCSSRGMGIESPQKADPGFVWFSMKVDGHRGGILMWSKKMDSMYRGGIKFIPLSAEDEQAIENEFGEEGRLKDPMVIADRMLQSLKKNGEPVIVQTE